MTRTTEELRVRFWGAFAPPAELAVERREPLVLHRPGPEGTMVVDVASVSAPGITPIELLIAYKTPLLARDVAAVTARIGPLVEQRRARDSVSRRAHVQVLPAVVTEAATPSAVEACRRAGLAVFDLRGTFVVQAAGVFIHVQGRAALEETFSSSTFAGKASRIVRFFLTTAAMEPMRSLRAARAIAAVCDVSYVHTYAILLQLESAGFIERTSPRSGFRVKDAPALLKAWVDSGVKTAVTVDAFNAPDTTLKALTTAATAELHATGNEPLFTLASALRDDEVFVSGLPHGAYVAGDAEEFASALGLRRVTPHNFLILRADPTVMSGGGSIWWEARERHDRPTRTGASVSMLHEAALPQLVVDFATLAGRGKEQSDFLLEKYAKSLPYHAGPP